MNPEEGHLRPQIMDRFGLRVVVRGLPDPATRLEAYKRVHAYQTNPRLTAAQFSNETKIAQEEIQIARDLLPQVQLTDNVARLGLSLINEMEIDSLRAEITLFEAARAYAIADGRFQVTRDDLHVVAPMALRLRRSAFITSYIDQQDAEDLELNSVINKVLKQN
jgi:magnesium chelatase subunit I